MAGETIRGLTIEIDASATGFNKSMAAARKDAKSTQKELDALQKSLELEYDPTTLERAQQVAQDAIDHTAEQAEVLRKRLEHLEKTGKADTSHYRQIKAELAQTELQVKKLQKEQEKLNNISLDRAAKTVKETRGELEELKKSLNVKFDSEKFARAQELVQNAIKASEEEARLLQERLAALEESGQIDTEEYKKFQEELRQCEEATKDLREEAEKLNDLKFEKLGSSVKSAGSAISSVGQAFAPVSAAATAAVGAMGALGAKTVSTADEVATLATQYGISADALQRFNYIALQTDTDSEVLYKSFVKMRSAAADIATGGASVAATALQKLNLDIQSFDGSEEQFLSILTALSDMEDQTQMVAIANDIFGERIANDLLPLIYAGSGAIREYADEYESLGALSGEQVGALAEFDNVLNRIKTKCSNTASQIGSSLLPLMESLAGFVEEKVVPKLQALAEWFGNLTLEQQQFGLKALLVVAAIAPLTIGIGKLVTGIGNVITVLPKLNKALSTLAQHPVILIIAAIVAVVMLLYSTCEEFRESINNLVGALASALQPILEAVMKLLQDLMPIITQLLDIVGGALAGIINQITPLLYVVADCIAALFGVISPLLSILLNLLGLVLEPLGKMLGSIMGILEVLIGVCLMPLTFVLDVIQVFLKIIGGILEWLSPLFVVFGNIVSGVFEGVIRVINFFLGGIETMVNGVIGLINGMIDAVNSAMGWAGVKLERLGEVKLQIETGEIETPDQLTATLEGDEDPLAGGTVYDVLGAGGTTGDIYNNDYSTNTTTQNVTVVIENYADEVDVDDLVQQINIKLAEAM